MSVQLFWLFLSAALIIPLFIRMISQARQAYREHNYKWMLNCLLKMLASIIVCTLIYYVLGNDIPVYTKNIVNN